MNTHKTVGIVLSRRHLPDADKATVLYTRGLGRVHARAAGAGRLQGRLKACTEPFAEADFHLWEPAAGSASVKIIGARLLAGFVPAPAILPEAAAICQLVENLTPSRQPNPWKYELLREALDAVCGARIRFGAERVRLAFEIHFLELGGWALQMSKCVRCDRTADRAAPDPGASTGFYFSADDGGLVCRDHRGGIPDDEQLSPADLRLFEKLRSTSLADLASAAPGEDDPESVHRLQRVARWVARHRDRHLFHPLPADVFRRKMEEAAPAGPAPLYGALA